MGRELKYTIEEIRKNAVQFLESHQGEDALWRDFETRSSGEGTEWVTGYITHCLALSQLARNDVLRKAVKKLLSLQRENGGWGFQPAVPPDADSTVSCLLAILSGDIKRDKSIKKAIDFLICHQKPEGGFSTYINSHLLKKYRQRGEEDFSGWCSVHNCVTGAAIRALATTNLNQVTKVIGKAINYLKHSQSKQGHWESYWCVTDLYAVYQVLEAFHATQTPIPNKNRVIRWILDQQSNNGCWINPTTGKCCAFSTSLAVLSLMIVNQAHDPLLTKVAIWLLENQREDGSWKSQPIMRIPPPYVKDPRLFKDWRVGERGVGSCSKDPKRLFTTATVLLALNGISQLKNQDADAIS